jgi:(2Fe-2S) ferredoxin
VEPTIDLGGRAIGLSTANGEGNFFHDMWLGAEAGDNGFHSVFFPWSAVDSRDEVWYEAKRAELAGKIWQLHQEYPSNPTEAFIGSGNPVFDQSIMRGWKALEGDEFTISGARSNDVALIANGPLTVWDSPNHGEKWTYVIGADIAEGLEHGDATVAWVLCVNTGKPVAVWYGRVDPDVFGEQVLPALGWFYRNALIVPEINNHGLTVLKALQRVKYRWLYRRRTFTKRSDRPLESLGWLTTHTSKPLLVDELGAWLRDLDNMPHQRTLHELRTFTRDVRGRMSGSPHDDCVMALGIAVQGLKYARTESKHGEGDAARVKGSFAWWERKLDAAKKGDKNLSPVV